MRDYSQILPLQVEITKLPRDSVETSLKIAVTYFVHLSNGKREIIKEFSKASQILGPHDLAHLYLNEYFKFGNCPINSIPDEAVVASFQLYHSPKFCQILQNHAKQNNFENPENIRKYFFEIIRSYVPKEQFSLELQHRLARVFDLSFELCDALERFGSPIGTKIQNFDHIWQNFLESDQSILESKDLEKYENPQNQNSQVLAENFIDKYGQNQFIMVIYNQIQTEINLLARALQ